MLSGEFSTYLGSKEGVEIHCEFSNDIKGWESMVRFILTFRLVQDLETEGEGGKEGSSATIGRDYSERVPDELCSNFEFDDMPLRMVF